MFTSSHIQFLKGTTGHLFRDYLFNVSPHPISFFWNVLCPWRKPGPGRPAWLPVPLPSPTASLSWRYQWLLQLTHISNLFLWSLFLEQKNKNKKMFWDVAHKKRKCSRAGGWQGRHRPTSQGSAAGSVFTARAFSSGPLWAWREDWNRHRWGQVINGIHIVTQSHLAFSLTIRFGASYLHSLSLGLLSTANSSARK